MNIEYYFDKRCAEVIPAVKSGIISYPDLKILLKHEKKHKNRVTIKRAINKQISKLKELDRKGTRKELKIERLESLNDAQAKELDLVDRIAEIVKNAIGTHKPIKAPKIYEPKTGHKEEIALLLLSDSHIGKETETYDPDKFTERLDNLRESMMSIISGLRNIRPIKKLIIVMNGDLLDAESIYESQGIDDIAVPIIDQLFKIGVPKLQEFLIFCLANFEEVEIICTPGNHGESRTKLPSSKSTNWDTVLYKSLELATDNQPRLTWDIAVHDWKKTFKVFDYGFLATHGDMIRSYYNLPFYGMTRQAQRWCNAYRSEINLDYFLFSHFHSLSCGQRFNDLEIFVNGSFVTSDEYAERRMGITSKPEQLLIGIHEEFGVSWRYNLQL